MRVRPRNPAESARAHFLPMAKVGKNCKQTRIPLPFFLEKVQEEQEAQSRGTREEQEEQSRGIRGTIKRNKRNNQEEQEAQSRGTFKWNNQEE